MTGVRIPPGPLSSIILIGRRSFTWPRSTFVRRRGRWRHRPQCLFSSPDGKDSAYDAARPGMLSADRDRKSPNGPIGAPDSIRSRRSALHLGYMPSPPLMSHRQAIKTISEDQIRKAMDTIAKKGLDAQVLMYNMQNSSTVEYQGADLHEWLAGMSDYGYATLVERLGRM